MLSPPRPSPAGPVPPSPLDPVSLVSTTSAPLTYLGAVHSLLHPARGVAVSGGAPSLPPPEWPFSLLALSLASATQQLQIALPPVPAPAATSTSTSALTSPSSASRPLDSPPASKSAASLLSPSTSPSSSSFSSPSSSPGPSTAGDALLRSYLRSPRSSVGQCVSWLMAAEHRVILHTTATFYTQQQQQAQLPHPASSRLSGKPNSAASRRSTQSHSTTSVSPAPLSEVRYPLLLGVGPGGADSNAPREGEVLVQDEQPLTQLKPHASSLWLQPARLSHQLLAYLSPPNAANTVLPSQQSAPTSVSMSTVTAVPIDVWAVLCARYKAGDTGRLCSLLRVQKIAGLSHLSKLLAAHIQALPPAPVIPPTANAASITNTPMHATMQLMAANTPGHASAAPGSSPLDKLSIVGHPSQRSSLLSSQSPGAPVPSDMPTTRRGFMAAMQLSEPLSRVVGHRFLSRPSVVRHLWAYIRSHNLQRPSEKRIIDCDPPLQEIMGTRSVTMFEMNILLTPHLALVKEGDALWVTANREAQAVEDADREEDERTGRKKGGDAKKKADAHAAAAADKKRKERERQDKKERSHGSSRSSKDSDRRRHADRESSRSKKERDRDSEASSRRKKHKSRQREEAEERRAPETSEEEQEEEERAAMRTAAASADASSERKEALRDDSDLTDDDSERGEAKVEADGDLSTQSEASSDEDEEQDDENESDSGAHTSQRDEQAEAAADGDTSMLEGPRRGDEDEDGEDTGQSADDMQDETEHIEQDGSEVR